MSEPEYKISKEDVEKMVHFLMLHRPSLATPEIAIRLLAKMHEDAQSIENLGDEELEKYLQDLEEH